MNYLSGRVPDACKLISKVRPLLGSLPNPLCLVRNK